MGEECVRCRGRQTCPYGREGQGGVGRMGCEDECWIPVPVFTGDRLFAGTTEGVGVTYDGRPQGSPLRGGMTEGGWVSALVFTGGQALRGNNGRGRKVQGVTYDGREGRPNGGGHGLGDGFPPPSSRGQVIRGNNGKGAAGVRPIKGWFETNPYGMEGNAARPRGRERTVREPPLPEMAEASVVCL